ncbi:caspase family protein [Iningainema tapete]|uniref:Caspase family protein n=1 Tax=Iningainema tapete BLCC-T55 TaxID=2748662 RepID=A0A8J6XLQ3_9CYAN|nr:caspase family protein [Iningainema tapete]MBD2772747.1 caspase family protein [Iningainema tapete BLCC-T55]
MAKNIYALLVGIDKYHPNSGVPCLYGCVNDIKAIEAYLRKRIITGSEWQLVESDVPWLLINEHSTRRAIINGFQQHLYKADSEDIALFYFAGHGSQEAAPQEFCSEEPDHLIENLVCYDSRTQNGLHLADKELDYLIYQLAKNNPHILVILDCCHSGTGTRNPEVAVRQAVVDGRRRDLKDFIFSEQWVRDRNSANYKPGRHVTLAACRSHETAKEYTPEDGVTRGVFSYFLMRSLHNSNNIISYIDLISNTRALVSGKKQEQSPQIEATHSEDLNQAFLGMYDAGDRSACFHLTYNSKKYDTWVINAGALHGIPIPSKGEEILLAIFPDNTREQLSQENEICQAKLTQVLPELSLVEIINDSTNLSNEQAYCAVIASLPLPQLKAYFQGDTTGVELARQALLTSGYNEQHSLFVREVTERKDVNFYVEASNGQYWIKQASNQSPLVAPIPEIPDGDGYTFKRAHQVIQRLEHIARWQNIIELKSPPTSRIKQSDVEMEVIICSGEKVFSSKSATSEMRGEYTYNNGKWKGPIIQIIVTNKSSRDLYFQIVELAGDYEVCIPPFFRERSSLFLPNKTKQGAIIESKKVTYGIPKNYLAKGITEYQEIFKLIVSTSDFDASLLTQKGLDSQPPTTRYTGGLTGSLNRLMNQVYTREAIHSERNDHWMTKEVSLTLVRRLYG